MTGLTASFVYGGSPSAAFLRIDLAFEAPESVSTDDLRAAFRRFDRAWTLSDTLFGLTAASLPESEAEKLRTFVVACVDDRIARTELEFPRVPANAVDEDVVPLRVSLTAGDETVDIPAQADGTYAVFGTACESLFASGDTSRRIGRSVERDVPLLWAVRVATKPDAPGIDCRPGDVCDYFAPAPVAHQVMSGTVEMSPAGPSLTFAGVDLHEWLCVALARMDAPKARRVLAAGVAPILATTKADAAAVEAASLVLGDALEPGVSALTSVRAIGVATARSNGWKAPMASVRVRGRVLGKATGPLGAATACLPAEADSDTRLAFVCAPEHAGEVTHLADTLHIEITAVECDGTVITFVTAPVERRFAGGAVTDVPLPLRSLPAPAALHDLIARPLGDPASPRELAQYACELRYSSADSAHDVVRVRVNATVPTPPAPSAAQVQLFEALARFNHSGTPGALAEHVLDDLLNAYALVVRPTADRSGEAGDAGGEVEAQAGPSRALVIQPLDICAVQAVNVAAVVARNSNLLAGVETAPVFQFHSPAAQLGPVVPSIEVVEWQLTADYGRTLTERLHSFFRDLLAGAVDHEVHVQITCAFTAAVGSGPPMVIPVVLMPPTAASAASLEFVQALGDAIESWRARQPVLDPAGIFQFAIAIYPERPDAAAPLLRISCSSR